MWQSDLVTGSSVLHTTDGLPTLAGEEPSPPRHEDNPDISPDHRRKRAGSASSEPARKHAVHEHKFDHEKAPLSTLSQALKIAASCSELNTQEVSSAILFLILNIYLYRVSLYPVLSVSHCSGGADCSKVEQTAIGTVISLDTVISHDTEKCLV